MKPIVLSILVMAVAFAGCAEKGGSGPDGDLTHQFCAAQGLVLGEDPVGTPACVDPPFVIEEFEDPDHYCVVNKIRDRIHAPDLLGDPWDLGQWWDFSLNVDGVDHGTTKLVYYDDQDLVDGIAQHYMVGTPTREEALQHALESINPMLGRVHAVLYSPHESGAHADMFHFPLCPGSSWSTVFYGETFELTATATALQVAGFEKPRPAFDIRGSSAEGSTLALSYSPDVQWFTFIDLDRADGSAVDMMLENQGNGYTGEAYFLRAQQDATVSMQAVALQAASPLVADETFTRSHDGDAYDTLGIRVKALLGGEQGAAQISVLAPDGTTAWTWSTQPGSWSTVTYTDTFEVPYQQGDWTLSVRALSLDAGTEATFEVELTAVSIYDRSCTIGGNCGA